MRWDDAVRGLAEELLESCDEIARLMALRLHSRIPEVGEDEEVLQTTIASCRSNVAQVLRLLTRGDPAHLLVVPPEAIEYARTYVQRGISLAVLLRAYRLGQEYLWDEWLLRAMNRRIADRETLAEAVERVSTWLFDYIDKICDELVDEYGTASERWTRGAAAVRAETAREIIAGNSTDDTSASARLGYELRRHHVGLVLWWDDTSSFDAPVPLEDAMSPLIRELGSGQPLIIPAGTGILWAWCGGTVGPAPVQALERCRLEEGLRVAVGRPASGREGFRRTHLEAREAARIARLGFRPASGVTTYASVELISLLTTDLERARVFVRSELGALAANDEPTERLRETLYVFLDEGMSRPRAATRLHVHQNTVSYRVSRALDLLDAPVEERRTSLVAALALARALGETVLPAGTSAA